MHMVIHMKERGTYGVKKINGEIFIYAKEDVEYSLPEITNPDFGYLDIDLGLDFTVPSTLIIEMVGCGEELLEEGVAVINKQLYYGTAYNEAEPLLPLIKIRDHYKGATLHLTKGTLLYRLDGYIIVEGKENVREPRPISIEHLE